jgi:hypothetical protein
MQAGRVAQLLEILQHHKVEFILVGGIAAVLQGAPLMTFDVDIVPFRSPANIERLLGALEATGARCRGNPEIRLTLEHLSSPGRQLLVTTFGPLDVIGAIHGEFDYANLLPHTNRLQLRGSTILVLKGEMLLWLKELSSDPADQSRAAVLRRIFKPVT